MALKLNLIRQQQTNMGCNISEVEFDKETTLQEFVAEILKYNAWGEVRIVTGEKTTVFNPIDRLDYEFGRIIKGFDSADLNSVIEKAKCWHSWSSADWYVELKR